MSSLALLLELLKSAVAGAPLAAAVLLPDDFLLLLALFLVAAGCLMTLATPGVTVAVQYHLPLASAQAWPSLAAP